MDFLLFLMGERSALDNNRKVKAMKHESTISRLPVAAHPHRDTSRVHIEGVVAGMIGGTTVAIWFLILDVMARRPLYTPAVLGSELFRLGIGIYPQESWESIIAPALLYTCVHFLIFAAIGAVVARLLAFAELNPNAGFGVLLLTVLLEFGFVAAAFVFAQPVLHALAWPAIFVGNLLAAISMAAYFRQRHPALTIQP